MQKRQTIEAAPMADWTTFRLGGPCRSLTVCATADELIGAYRESAGEVLVIGQGSNLLISDAGLDCTVLRYFSEDIDFECDAGEVRVSGAALLDDFAQCCVAERIEGFGFCSGIPGTVGGAIAGNAGAFGRQIGDALLRVRLLQPDGAVEMVSAEQLGFAYRCSKLRETGGIVLDAWFHAVKGDAQRLSDERAEIMQFRRERHPDWRVTPCAGSFFRNIEPTSAAERRQAAGWFLEEAGAHGMRVGGAHVFEKHANILVAEPGCTAQDVHDLAEKLKEAVRGKFGFELEPEVRQLGAFR